MCALSLRCICSPGVPDYANGTFYGSLGLYGCSPEDVLAHYNSTEEALKAFVADGGTVVACMKVSWGADFVCPAGHYCPEGLGSLADGRCPRGTFSNHTGLANISQCMSCTAGMYCNDTGMTEPAGLCDAGYYCSSGAADAEAAVCAIRGGQNATVRGASSLGTGARGELWRRLSGGIVLPGRVGDADSFSGRLLRGGRSF